MPTKAQLENALRNADKAGDVEAAKQLAKALKTGNYDDGFSAIDMIKNIPGSAANAAKGIINTVAHPIETAKGVGKLASGALYKANQMLEENTPESLSFMAKPITGDAVLGEENAGHVDAAKQAILNRYGSIEAFKRTLETDPVGVAFDISAIVAPFSQKASAAINPINATINTGKYALGKAIPKGSPAKMYESVAKFSTTLPKAKRDAMIKTALKNKIMPTHAGVDKLDDLITGLNSKIDDLITTAEKSGKSVPRSAVYRHLKALRRDKGGARLDAPGDLQAINKVIRDFELHMKRLGKENLSPKELQKLKVDAYKSINWDAKRMTGAPIKEDTYKAVARGAKDSIEDLSPNVKGVNQELGALYELKPALQRSANRIENRNSIPIDAPLQIAAGSSAIGGAGAAAGTISSVLGLPKFKAFRALLKQGLIDDAKLSQFLKNNPNISMAEVAAVIAGREPIASDQ